MKTKIYSIVALASFVLWSGFCSAALAVDPLAPPVTQPDGYTTTQTPNPTTSPYSTTGTPSNPYGSTSGQLNIPQTGLPDSQSGIKPILEKILVWLLGIFGMVAIIAFIISGLQYLLSAGNDDMAKTAKRNMTYSILGVIVALSAVVIITAINSALSGTSLF